MDESKKEFGKRLAEVRKAKKLKQKDLQELIGAPTVQMISGWEKGHSFPSSNYLIILAKKLDISLDYLLLGRESGSKSYNLNTYKDAMIFMTLLADSGLFELSTYQYGPESYHIEVNLNSRVPKIRDFCIEYKKLYEVEKTLGTDLYLKGLTRLLNNYDIPLTKNKNSTD